jgi:hypothetical protein
MNGRRGNCRVAHFCDLGIFGGLGRRTVFRSVPRAPGSGHHEIQIQQVSRQNQSKGMNENGHSARDSHAYRNDTTTSVRSAPNLLLPKLRMIRMKMETIRFFGAAATEILSARTRCAQIALIY